MKAVHLETDDRRLIEAAKRNSNGDEAVEASLLHHLFVCPKWLQKQDLKVLD